MSAIVPAVGAYGASYVPTVGALPGYGAVHPGLGYGGAYGALQRLL